MQALLFSNLRNGVVAIALVQSLDQAWDQMWVFGRFLHCRNGRARGLAFPRSWTDLSIGQGGSFVLVSEQILLGLLLDQAQIAVL